MRAVRFPCVRAQLSYMNICTDQMFSDTMAQRAEAPLRLIIIIRASSCIIMSLSYCAGLVIRAALCVFVV